jgi:hypothetical protein
VFDWNILSDGYSPDGFLSTKGRENIVGTGRKEHPIPEAMAKILAALKQKMLESWKW